MNTNTPKICTKCGAEHLGIYSHTECADCYFKKSAYWEKQTKKDKIISILIYSFSAIAVIATLYAMFFS